MNNPEHHHTIADKLSNVSTTTKTTTAGASIITLLTLAIAFAEDIKGLFAEMPIVGTNEEVQALEAKHDADMAVIGEWSKKAYGGTIPSRILSLLKGQCNDPVAFMSDPSRERLLNDLLNDYEVIHQREYPVGTCNELGEYCNAMNQCSH